ncbi:hypothetical protein KY329_01535 [Candidatus Woesearchaeota archaeon]|nr:hypothetical protein [Candidatus Woesearchaeota archaeon]
MQDVIKRFVETQDKIHSLIVHNELDKAKTLYHDLLGIYNQISESDMEYFHKQLAHEQISAVHGDLTAAEKTVRVPVNVIVAIVLVVALSALVFINPSIVGLITFQDEVTQAVNITFTESKIMDLNLKDVPLSISASGSYEGDVKLFYKVGDDLTLIFDSSTTDGNTFTKVCEDTCSVKSDSNSIELFAQVGDDSVLKLDEIIYTVARDDNSAPVWKSKTREFTISGEYELNLDEYFEDPDGDELVYLSTSDKGLKVTVSNNIVRIVPESKGEMQITVIASDLDKLTKVPLKIVSK